jgi:hypothetical protein
MLKRTTLAAALCALAVPAAASAEPRVDYYSVLGTGQGTYKLDIDGSTSDYVSTDVLEAQFSWRSFIPTVKFVDGRFVGVMQNTRELPQLSGSMTRAIRSIDKRPGSTAKPLVVDCKGAQVQQQAGVVDMHGSDRGPTALEFDAFAAIEFLDHSCSPGGTYPFGLFQADGDPHALQEEYGVSDVFEQRFELPPEAIGSGRIVQWVKPEKDQILGPNCPMYSQAPGERCTVKLDWAGSVTFTKVNPDELIAPLTPIPEAPPRFDQPAPSAPPAPPKAATPSGPVTPTPPAPKPPTGTLTKDGRKAKVPCTASCSGTLTIKAGGKTFVRPFQGTRGVTRVTGLVPRGARPGSRIRVIVKVRSRGRTTTRTLTFRAPRR